MLPARRARALLLIPTLVLVLTPADVAAQAPPPGEWKLFQEFNFVIGSWSGPAQSAEKIGGRVITVAPEVDGAALGYRATTYYPAKDGQPESRTEEIARIVYDGSRGKYLALLVFSTKVWGLFDAEVRPDGSIRFTSREMANLEAGVRSRWTLSKKPDGTLSEELDVAPAGKDFVPFVRATLTKK
jgi:hypothetical protein